VSWSTVSPTVLPLVGVFLGTTATLVSQHLATRVSQREAKIQRAAVLRAERKAAIVDFLDAAQRVEHLLDRTQRGGQADEQEAGELMHRLWLTYKCAEIVCSVATAQKAQDYTLQLHHYVWDGIPEGSGSSTKREARHAFLDAAGKELDPERSVSLRRGSGSA
jgi:hypothetical protein